MSDLLTCPPEALAKYNLRSAREHLHVNLWNMNWYCRHARQDMDKVAEWPVPYFRSNLSVLHGIVEKEWEVPGD